MPKYTLRSSDNIRNAYYNMFIAKESTEMDEAGEMEEQECAKEGDIEIPDMEAEGDPKKAMIERAKGLLEEAMAEIEGASGAEPAVEDDDEDLGEGDADLDADMGGDDELADVDADIADIGDEPVDEPMDDTEVGGDSAKLDQIIDLLSQLVSLEKGETGDEEPEADIDADAEVDADADAEEPEVDDSEEEPEEEKEESVMEQAKEALKNAKKAMEAMKGGKKASKGKTIVGGNASVKTGAKAPAIKQTGKSSKKK